MIHSGQEECTPLPAPSSGDTIDKFRPFIYTPARFSAESCWCRVCGSIRQPRDYREHSSTPGGLVDVCAAWRGEVLATVTDDGLVQRTLDGRPEAFEEVFRRYSRPLYSFILTYVGDYDLAQDAFQEAFLRAFRNVRKYHIGTNFGAWLHKVALNASKDYLKKRKRFESMEIRETEEFQPLSLVSAQGPTPHDRVEKAELQGLVREALRRLSPAHREVLLLYQFQGFSYEEIAQILSCPLGTVKSRIHYAMKHLQEVLAPFKDERF
jgi:RNA polymerase sigma-70 factor (ECF subfamily)